MIKRLRVNLCSYSLVIVSTHTYTCHQEISVQVSKLSLFKFYIRLSILCLRVSTCCPVFVLCGLNQSTVKWLCVCVYGLWGQTSIWGPHRFAGYSCDRAGYSWGRELGTALCWTLGPRECSKARMCVLVCICVWMSLWVCVMHPCHDGWG